jgi:hypothetical protein
VDHLPVLLGENVTCTADFDVPNYPILVPAPAKGSTRAARAAGKRAARAPLNQPGVVPQAPLMVNGRASDVPPPTEQDVAREEAKAAEFLRYKGTKVVPHRSLKSPEAQVKAVCALLSQADFIPELRVRRFAGLDRRLTVVEWRLTIEKLEVRQNDTLVHVRATPIVRAPGETAIGVMTYYREDYRIAGGKLESLGGEPLPADLTIFMSGQ